MHSTRRLLDRHLAVPMILGCLVAAAASASCSSDDVELGQVHPDAGHDAAESPVEDAGADADADAPPPDAGPFEPTPLPVVCEGSPCATALVTTMGADPSDRAEGFCALLSDGTVACWGAGRAGQLGRGDDAPLANSATAARVVGLTDVVSLHHTCAIDSAGEVHCWGTGPYLASDMSATTMERTPVKLPIPRATAVSTSFSTGCAATESGVLCWGQNLNGQIVPNDYSFFTVFSPQEVAVPAGAPIRELVLGAASFVLREDGSTLSWGANPPLGRASPLFPDPFPLPVALDGISNMDVAYDNACAVAGGTGYCWGVVVETPGEPISKTDRAIPEPIATPTPILRIATTRTIIENEFGTRTLQQQRWCASSVTGDVHCAGYNASGQAGDGTKDFALNAVKVVGLPGPAADVKTTPDASCALLTSGKVYCWGANSYGQLGNGAMKVPSLVPQEVVLP